MGDCCATTSCLSNGICHERDGGYPAPPQATYWTQHRVLVWPFIPRMCITLVIFTSGAHIFHHLHSLNLTLPRKRSHRSTHTHTHFLDIHAHQVSVFITSHSFATLHRVYANKKCVAESGVQTCSWIFPHDANMPQLTNAQVNNDSICVFNHARCITKFSSFFFFFFFFAWLHRCKRANSCATQISSNLQTPR